MNFLKKFFAVVAVLCIFTTTFAAEKAECKKPKVCCKAPNEGPFAFCYPQELNLACPSNFYFDASFLIMQMQKDGLEFSVFSTCSDIYLYPNNKTTVYGFSSDKTNWDWSPGFRLGFGSYTNKDRWTLDAVWTYLHTNEKRGIKAKNQVLFPTVFPPSTVPTMEIGKSSHARWECTLNYLDLTLGKAFHISRYFAFKPFAGLRLAFIDDDFNINYFGTFTFPTGGGASFQSNAKFILRDDTWAAGLKASFDSEFILGSGWSIFNKIGGSFLSTKVDVNQQLSIGRGAKVHKDFFIIIPTLEANVGVSWGKYLDHNKMHLSLSAAYEFQCWWQQTHIIDFAYTTTYIEKEGNLKLMGFAFGAKIDF